MKKINIRCLVVGVLLGIVASLVIEKYDLNYDRLIRGRHWVRWVEQVPLPSGDTLTMDRAIFVVPGAGVDAKYSFRFKNPMDEAHNIIEWETPSGSLIPVGIYKSRAGLWRIILEEAWATNMPNSTCSGYTIFQHEKNGLWEHDQTAPTVEDTQAFAKGFNLKLANDNTGEVYVRTGFILQTERKSKSSKCKK